MADREEHLKKARERLKKFQKKKQCETATQGSTPDLDDVDASFNKEEGDGVDDNSKRSTPKNDDTIDLAQSQHYTFESQTMENDDPFSSIMPIATNTIVDADESSSVSDQIQTILDNSKTQRLSEFDSDINENEILKTRLSQLETENQELKNEKLVLQQKNSQLQNVSNDSVSNYLVSNIIIFDIKVTRIGKRRKQKIQINRNQMITQ